MCTDPITTIVSLDMLDVGNLSPGINSHFIGTIIDVKPQCWSGNESRKGPGKAISPPRSYDKDTWHVPLGMQHEYTT